MHRTTILLNEDLERKLKQKAKKEGKSVTGLIQEYIRSGLNQPTLQKKNKLSLPSFSMGSAKVDPADRDSLWDLMDGR